MSLVTTLYNNILRRSSTYALAIAAGAFFFERGFDLASEHIYNEINKGVSIYQLIINGNPIWMAY